MERVVIFGINNPLRERIEHGHGDVDLIAYADNDK